jgi:hypothetical protein
MSSASPPNSDIARCGRHFAYVLEAAIHDEPASPGRAVTSESAANDGFLILSGSISAERDLRDVIKIADEGGG